ncbi:MAG: DNA mismatch repair endonuclease MutL [Planctomycetota bacterium]
MPTEGTSTEPVEATGDAGPRRPIQKLSPLLVNQIAAGEVIERPASVVKELVENALDAGATRIRVELEAGGLKLVRITDDGSGIPPDELPMALEPHATSKITEAEDLDRVGTLGFRGEAVASIASIARMRIRSRAAGSDECWEIASEGGSTSDARPASGPPGTTFEVRDLFFNTPARRKFLKTPQTERGRCLDWLRDLALAHPAVGFTMLSEGRSVLELPPGQGPRTRAASILGKELEGELLEVSADEHDDSRGIGLWGLVGTPSVARATAKAQHVILNGRVIRDRVIQHAMREAYRGLIEPGRHPTAVLLLEMPPGAVDVNVHPAKLEVRFRDGSLVYAVVHRAIRDALRAADLTPAFGGEGTLPRFLSPAEVLPPPTERVAPGKAVDAAAFAREVRELAIQPAKDGKVDLDTVRRALEEKATALEARLTAAEEQAPGVAHEVVRTDAGDASLPTPKRADRVLQVHNSYLLTQDSEGVVIIDQHALHERVMFERLLERVGEQGTLESQSLLTPVVVEATSGQMAAAEKLGDLCAQIGLTLRELGPRSLGIEAFPTFLFERKVDPSEFVRDVLARAEEDGFAPDAEEAMREVLDMMACKAAVKAGDRMSDGELEELLTLRERYERASRCPHGRPTAVRLTIEQLERLFGRR